MTLIANPIYDVVFKYMMEDERVARMLLSALLKKVIVELQMRQHEYTSVQQNRISLFRMDFSAKIREEDGSEHLILIELQKTWLPTETLRFRQYLGVQYQNKNNMLGSGNRPYGLPIISIYILGHTVGNLKEPVVYVRRRYLDYDDQVIEQIDPFVESLTHDSIIVQIPYLKGSTRNRLERLLNVFDQDFRSPENEHLIDINEEIYPADEMLIVTRLLKAGVAPDIRRAMDVEDEILSEIEARDTVIMQKDQLIGQKDQELEQKKQLIGQKDQELEQKEQLIGQKEQLIGQKDQELEQKEQLIGQKEQELAQKEQLLQMTIKMLSQAGIPPEKIAEHLSLSVDEVTRLLE